MQNQSINRSDLSLKLESRNFYSIFGLYLFSLGAVISGYSLYLLLEAVGQVERKISNKNKSNMNRRGVVIRLFGKKTKFNKKKVEFYKNQLKNQTLRLFGKN